MRLLAVGLIAVISVLTGLGASAAPRSAAKWSSSVAADATTIDGFQTLWGSRPDARVEVDPETADVELGTTFTTDVDGYLAGVRYYKTALEVGRHTGSLWSSDGSRLATVLFENESSEGWQTALFNEPVEIEAGEEYVVSYSSNGRYAISQHFYRDSASPNLSVPRGESGVYKYGSRSQFPVSTWRSSQYWVDVLFTTDRDAGTETPTTEEPTASPSPSDEPTEEPSETTAEPTPSATPEPSPSSTTTTPAPEPTPSPSASPTPSPSPTATTTPEAPTSGGSSDGFPTAETTGLPDGWSPSKTVNGDYWIRTPGAVVSDLRVTGGTIHVAAANVTLERVEGVSTNVLNYSSGTCYNGLRIVDSSFVTDRNSNSKTEPAIGHGGYTLENVLIDGPPEGPRVGGQTLGCGAVTIRDSFIRIVSPVNCGDWHGDGVQGYGGAALTVRNTTIFMEEVGGCYGTAPFFYPSSQGNTSVDIDGLLVAGGGYSFRNGMPGRIVDLNVVDGSWSYGPAAVRCSLISTWQASVVRLDASGQPTTVRSLPCSTEND